MRYVNLDQSKQQFSNPLFVFYWLLPENSGDVSQRYNRLAQIKDHFLAAAAAWSIVGKWWQEILLLSSCHVPPKLNQILTFWLEHIFYILLISWYFSSLMAGVLVTGDVWRSAMDWDVTALMSSAPTPSPSSVIVMTSDTASVDSYRYLLFTTFTQAKSFLLLIQMGLKEDDYLSGFLVFKLGVGRISAAASHLSCIICELSWYLNQSCSIANVLFSAWCVL